jgi:lysophospholipase L1-like esterase
MSDKGARKFFLAALPTLSALVVLLLGFGLGRYYVARPLRKEIIAFSRGETLGQLLSHKELSSLSPAYEHSVAADIDHYIYSIPNVPTPFVGSGPKPGQSGNVFINSMQFRSRREVEMPKPLGVYRIFLTGGSTIFGAGAPNDDSTIGAYLDRRLNEGTASGNPAYEVFTLADPGWTSTQERIVIENRLSELSPDLVISFSGLNDVHWAGAGRDVLWFRNFADQHYWDLLNETRHLAGFSSLPDVVAPPSAVSSSQIAERLEKNVRLSATALAFRNSRYVFILQPMIATTNKSLSPREKEIRTRLPSPAAANFIDGYRQIRARLSAIHQIGFEFVDRSNVFDSLTEQDEIFLDSYHFGDRGNKLIANTLAAMIPPPPSNRQQSAFP